MLERHYPNDLLISGFDILFFWDARMAMQGMHFMHDVPWNRLYLHGLVRAADGQKMSKSKGNVVDPLGLIVPRSTLAEAPLADGDVLEIVTFVGGGDHFAPAIACSFLPSPLAGEEGAPSGAEGEGSAAQAAAGAADPSPNPLPQGERAE